MEAAPRAAVQLSYPGQAFQSPQPPKAGLLQNLAAPEAELSCLLQPLEIIYIATPPCSVTVISKELSLLPSTCEVH